MRGRLATLALALLSACGPPAAPPGNTVASLGAPTPMPAATAAATDLSAYVGHYPFDDVGERSFVDDPAILAAITASGADGAARTFIAAADGPATPIERRGDRLFAWGCEAHNCDAHQWSVSITSDARDAEVCHADDGPPTWWKDGRREDKTESCN